MEAKENTLEFELPMKKEDQKHLETMKKSAYKLGQKLRVMFILV